MYRDFQSAFVEELRQLVNDGKEVTVKGAKTYERLMHSFTISNATRRVAIIPGRSSNIFAQVAETMWMMAGRDDLDFLERYIPSVRKWSDDGETWRGAYGPRLRNWPTYAPSLGSFVGTDQFEKCGRRINADKDTRQAIISLWDPARDNVAVSKDYPCNNWLHFIRRDGKLHLNVAVRSNDIMFGFSHVDFFGWSVLLEAMALWTGSEVGNINWNATSFHLYERHYEKAGRIIQLSPSMPLSLYDYGYTPVVWNAMLTPMDERLSILFEVDRLAATGQWEKAAKLSYDDPNVSFHIDNDDMITWAATLFRCWHLWKKGLKENAALLINSMPSIDLRIAAIEFFYRRDMEVYDLIHLNERDKEFMADYGSLLA